MTSPILDISSTNPLFHLLQEQFSSENLAALVGAEGAELSELWNAALRTPLSHFLAQPGKELRAQLVSTCYAVAGGRGTCPPELALIIEALHAGSLIVDDIEDNSLERRGQPALHVQCGLPTALNAGNWMYFWALTLVDRLELAPEDKCQLLVRLNSTLLRCHFGQGLDISARVWELKQAEVASVVRTSTTLKTGALMELAAAMAAVVAGAPGQTSQAIAMFGGQLGVALQMLDDLSGLLSERRKHKGEEDLWLGRPTWPWAWLAEDLGETSFARLQELSAEVSGARKATSLLARSMREALSGSGRVRVRRHINQAFSTLRQSLGPSSSLEQLKADIQRLEKGYG